MGVLIGDNSDFFRCKKLKMTSSSYSNKVPDSSDDEEREVDDTYECVSETPQKKSNENKLSGSKQLENSRIPIPMLNLERINSDEFMLSPEIKKCNLEKNSASSDPLAMLKKIKEEAAKKRARATLFKDEANTNEKAKLVLPVKSFYGTKSNSIEKLTAPVWKESITKSKKKNSPSYSSNQRRSLSKSKRNGGINVGVSHNIKRPKIKRLNTNMEKLKIDSTTKEDKEVPEIFNPVDKFKIKNNTSKPSTESCSEKKFFKCKASDSFENTKNEKADNVANKQANLSKETFDLEDSITEQQTLEKTEEISKVDNIIQMLEKDWVDNDSDDMEAMEANSSFNSPSKNSDASSAYELSNTDFARNIKDSTEILLNEVDENSQDIEKLPELPTQKLFPLFTKGYTLKDKDETKKIKKNNNWQLSKKYGNSHDQYQLDAGQKIFGAVQCEECKIIYHAGDADDENAHLNYHNNHKVLKFQGWKNEKVVFEDNSTLSRIIVIEPKDNNLYWKKVIEILEFVDKDLGLSDVKLTSYRNKKVYLYIRDKTVVGVLVAENIEVAFRMIPDLIELNCCTSESTPVKCGINVVWTAMNYRNQGIASKLVDILRSTYYYGYIMSVEDIAFSIPSVSGKKFAEKYTNSKTFKVY